MKEQAESARQAYVALREKITRTEDALIKGDLLSINDLLSIGSLWRGKRGTARLTFGVANDLPVGVIHFSPDGPIVIQIGKATDHPELSGVLSCPRVAIAVALTARMANGKVRLS